MKSSRGGSSFGRRPATATAAPPKQPTTKPSRSVGVGDGLVGGDALLPPPPSPPLYSSEMSAAAAAAAEKSTSTTCPKRKISRSISVGTDAVVVCPAPNNITNLFEIHDRELRTIYIGHDATTPARINVVRSVRNVGIMCRSAMRDVGVMHLSHSERPLMRSIGVGVGETGVNGSCFVGGTIRASESRRIHIGDDQLRSVLDEMLKKTVHSVAVQCNGSPTADRGVDACRLGGAQVSDAGCGEDSVDVDVTPKRSVKSVAVDNRPSVFHRACCTDHVLTIDCSTNTQTCAPVTCDVSTNTDRLDSSSKATITDCPVGRSISTEVETFFFGNFGQDVATNTDTVPAKSYSSVGTSTELTGEVRKREEKPATVSHGTNTFGSSLSVDHKAVNTDPPQLKTDRSTLTLNPTLQDRGCNTVKVRLMTASTITNKLSCVSRAVGDRNSILGLPETENGDFKTMAALNGNGAKLSSAARSDEFSGESFNAKERPDDTDSLIVNRFNATVEASLDYNSTPQSMSTCEKPSEHDGAPSLATPSRTVPPTFEAVETRRREYTFAFEDQHQQDYQPKTSTAALKDSTLSSPYDGTDQRRLLWSKSDPDDSGSESPLLSESDESIRTQCSAFERRTTVESRKRRISSEEKGESIAGEANKAAKNVVDLRQSSGDRSQKVLVEDSDDLSRNEDGRHRQTPPYDPHVIADRSQFHHHLHHHRTAVDDTRSREPYHRFVDSFEVTITALPANEAGTGVDAMWTTWQKAAPLTGDEATAGSKDDSVKASDRCLSEDNSWSTTVEWPSGTSVFSDQSVTTTEFTLSRSVNCDRNEQCLKICIIEFCLTSLACH